MTLVRLMEIATEDVDPSAGYRFRIVETEMDNCEIHQFDSDWIEFWQPEITKKQIENIQRIIK